MTNEELVIRIKAGIDVSENMLQLWEQTKSFIHTVALHYQGFADLEDLEQEGETTLTSLVKRSESRSEVTAVFLALLELCRGGKVHLAGTMEDPSISLRGEEEGEGEAYEGE